ncbi:fibronectin type III domain-containing protein [Streptomyces sp. FR-108]|uniref:fibronectin type III domain-containing protein n=1 Tax=Streptomyces sp. FR-108 TaxID=3416665 RepID=UPI003CF694E1
MAVSEVLHALGSFEVKLTGSVPREVLDSIDYFGHIAILPGRVDTVQAGDNSLTSARYVGVVRKKKIGDDGRTNEVGDAISVGGVGVAFWLGDDDSDRGKGDIFEAPQTFTSQTFANTVRALLPDAVTEGTLYSVAGTFTNKFQYVTPRTAIQYVCDTMSTDPTPVSWRVNGDASVDAGPESDLYVTNPTCVVLRRGFGEDMAMRALEGSMDVEQDMEDFTTRVVLLAEGEGTSTATGSANISGGLNPYKDLQGNPLKLTRLVSESDTATGNATARAQLQLNRFTGTRDSLSLSTADYDVHGSFSVGDYIWVYDPDADLVDTNNEIVFRGERLNPLKLQVHETSWSITNGYSVGYRDRNGNWFDLTDYVDFETDASSKVVVGEFSRTLSVASGESVGTRPNADTSIPGSGAWVEPFTQSNYQTDIGFTYAQITLAWDEPNNADGSTIVDGDHYEIQHKVSGGTTWHNSFVAFDQNTFELNGLATGVTYVVRIRAVDTTLNIGPWVQTSFVTNQDNIAPSTPAAPTVAASRIAVQVTHTLGKASGGTYNLEQDLNHLEIHVGASSGFTANSSTLRGTVRANQGMITGSVAAVQTVPVEETTARHVKVIAVDEAGNKSAASVAASATAQLIDNAHISDLTVTKVTAGTISADWIVGSRIKTADTGARVEMSASGISAFSSGGTKTVDIKSSDGSVAIIGQLTSGTSGKRLVVNATNTLLPEIRFYPDSGTDFGYINAVSAASGTVSQLGMNSSFYSDSGVSKYCRTYLTDGGARMEVLNASQAASGGYVYASNSSFRAGIAQGSTFDSYLYADTNSVIANYGTTSSGGGRIVLSDSASSFYYKQGTSSEQGFRLDSTTSHEGTWPDYADYGSTQGIFSGSLTGTNGAASVSASFGGTKASQLLPIVSVRDNIIHAHTITASDNTGFTVEIDPAASGAWSIYFWCFRI